MSKVNPTAWIPISGDDRSLVHLPGSGLDPQPAGKLRDLVKKLGLRIDHYFDSHGVLYAHLASLVHFLSNPGEVKAAEADRLAQEFLQGHQGASYEDAYQAVATTHPHLFESPIPDTAAEIRAHQEVTDRLDAQAAVLEKLREGQPELDWDALFDQARGLHPDLFNESKPWDPSFRKRVFEDYQAPKPPVEQRRLEAVKLIQAANPGTNYDKAWQMAARRDPDLFREPDRNGDQLIQAGRAQ